MGERGIGLFILSGLSLLTSGCITIEKPPEGASVCPFVEVLVTSSVAMDRFRASLDGVDVTSQFTVSAEPTASLDATPGQHTLVASGDLHIPFGPYHTSRVRMFSVPAFSVRAQPPALMVARNTGKPVSISVAGCGAPADVTIAVTPRGGLTATPTSMIALSLPSSVPVTLNAAPDAAVQRYVVTVNAVSAGRMSSASIFVDLTTPSLTAVTPGTQVRGGAITLTGSGFDPGCTGNSVIIGGKTVTPAPPCSETSFSLRVPDDAAYGAGQVVVNVNQVPTQGVPLTVARMPGPFTDAYVARSIVTPKTCMARGATYTLQTTVVGNAGRAVYTTPGRAIATFDFDYNHDQPPPTAGGLGGAGFSGCVAGAVLDAGPPQVFFVDLESGARGTPYPFSPGVEFEPGTPTVTWPSLFQSPDGTLLLAATAGVFIPGSKIRTWRLALLDMDKARLGQVVYTDECYDNPLLSTTVVVTSDNELSFSCTNSLGTTTKRVAIP